MIEPTTEAGAAGRSRYRVAKPHSSFVGQVGVMVERFANLGYNDIKLEFEDGSRIWFDFRDVERVAPATLPTPAARDGE